MLERYTAAPMGRLWSDRTRLETWALVETLAAAAKGAPKPVIDALREAPVPDPDEVEAEEAVTRHDVMAFLNVWRRGMSADVAGWVHRGMTSSDLVDTANAVRLAQVSDEIYLALHKLTYETAHHALMHWDTPRLARTHGQAAEASTWGYRVADFSLALLRCQHVLSAARSAVLVAKLSGPVGNYAHTRYAEEVAFARALDLTPVSIATQVVMRDRLSDLLYACARIASVVEALALEIRLGAQFGVQELAEGFAPGQAGSSAMPHKANPITAEQLCGLAKIVRAQLDPVMQGIALWNERDINHSSVERLAVQTATTVTHYMLTKAVDLVRRLVVHDSAMRANLSKAGDATLSAWAKDSLVNAGLHPEDAWSLVHQASRAGGDLIYALNTLLAQHNSGFRLDRPKVAPTPDTGHVAEKLRHIVRTYRSAAIGTWRVPDAERVFPNDLIESRPNDRT